MKTSNKLLLTGLISLLVIMVIVALVLRIAVNSPVLVPGVSASARVDSNQTNQNEISQKIEGVNNIQVYGAWQIQIIHGDDYSLKIVSPKMVLSKVMVRQVGSTLTLRIPDSLNFEELGVVRAYLVIPDLKGIEVNGATAIYFSGYKLSQLVLNLTGTNQLRGKDNTIQDLSISSAGASAVDLFDSSIVNAKLHTSGSSDIKLNMVGGDLTGLATGIARIIYHGTVNHRDVRTFGMSSVSYVP